MISIMYIFLFSVLSHGEEYIQQPDDNFNSQASPHTYMADTMYLGKKMVSRPTRPMFFFHKHCTEVGQKYYYSKTSYECENDIYK